LEVSAGKREVSSRDMFLLQSLSRYGRPIGTREMRPQRYNFP